MGAGSCLKALEVLECLAAHAEGLTLAEVSRATGLPKSTCHRLLTALEASGHIVKEFGSLRYRLGARILRLSEAYSRALDLRELAQRYLRQLAELTQETIHLVKFEETCGVYIDKIDTPHAIGLMSRIGAQLMLHCTAAGKSILAYLSDDRLRHVVSRVGLPRRTPNTITTYAQLESELAVVRVRGYAIDNEENRVGVVCIGAPVFNHSGEPVAAISISAPVARMDVQQAEGYAVDLLTAALALSVKVGYCVDGRVAGWRVRQDASHFVDAACGQGGAPAGKELLA